MELLRTPPSPGGELKDVTETRNPQSTDSGKSHVPNPRERDVEEENGPSDGRESLDQLETGKFKDIVLVNSPSNTPRGICQHVHSTD